MWSITGRVDPATAQELQRLGARVLPEGRISQDLSDEEFDRFLGQVLAAVQAAGGKGADLEATDWVEADISDAQVWLEIRVDRDGIQTVKVQREAVDTMSWQSVPVC